MSELSLKIWDGTRALLKRDVISRHHVTMGRLGIVAATESLQQATDWCFEQDDHKIVVHLDGVMNRLDCEFFRGPSGSKLPKPGDVWIIPAGCRYAALAQGEWAKFVEFTVPTSVLDQRALMAKAGYRDDFLHSAAARIATLIARRDDDLAVMASHAISNAVELHLMECFSGKPSATRVRCFTAADKAMLVEIIRGQLDNPPSLGALATIVGMSVRQFTSAFQNAFGETPWQFVLRTRLDHAANLLRQTNQSITDIALAAGFATPSHFSTTFSLRFGVPPSRYRASLR